MNMFMDLKKYMTPMRNDRTIVVTTTWDFES